MILSPRMVHALKEWPRMRQGAEAAGFAVVSVRDPRIGDAEWRAAVLVAGVPAALALPRLQGEGAASMQRLGALNHSPSAVLRLGYRLHPWPVLGVMPDAAFVAVLRQRLRQLCEPSP